MDFYYASESKEWNDGDAWNMYFHMKAALKRFIGLNIYDQM